MFRQTILMVFAGALGVLAVPAYAISCADRDTVVQRLQNQYNENLSAGGLQTFQNKQTLVEVWSSSETGTFTVMLTNPDGVTCVVATGTDWHQTNTATPAAGKGS